MQEDIIKLLERKHEPLAGKEIAILLNERPEKVFKSLKKLIEHGEILFKTLSMEEARKMKGKEKIKRFLRLYYIKLD